MPYSLYSASINKWTRKGRSIPYIAHLMEVCASVLEIGGDEDQAIAALLHGTVEGQGFGRLETLDTIRRIWGERVATALRSYSDGTEYDLASERSWRERKGRYLAYLPILGRDSLIIIEADSLSDVRAMLSDYRRLGERFWQTHDISKDEQFWYYTELIKVLRETSAPRDEPLIDEIERVVEELKREAQRD